MGKFVANPQILRLKGKEMLDTASEFSRNVDLIYKTINEMTTSNYLDPAARAIANEIESYHDDLNRMTAIIGNYGNFCINVSVKVINNQDDIISKL